MTTNERPAPGSGFDKNHPVGIVEDEHRTLRSQLDVISAATTATALMAGLAPLPKMLSEHFAGEEKIDGLFDDLRKRRPARAGEIDALRDEHRIILDEFDALTRQVKTQLDDEQAAEEIGSRTSRDVGSWVERLRGHEHEESILIGDVYYTDEGGG